jgi:hypothetical protein
MVNSVATSILSYLRNGRSARARARILNFLKRGATLRTILTSDRSEIREYLSLDRFRERMQRFFWQFFVIPGKSFRISGTMRYLLRIGEREKKKYYKNVSLGARISFLLPISSIDDFVDSKPPSFYRQSAAR